MAAESSIRGAGRVTAAGAGTAEEHSGLANQGVLEPETGQPQGPEEVFPLNGDDLQCWPHVACACCWPFSVIFIDC